MVRPIVVPALLVAVLVAASCRTSPTEERRRQVGRGALITRELRDYRTIVSAHQGRVGYLKSYDIAEAGGPAYPWQYVYDADWTELGMVDQFGNAYVYHRYSPSEQAQQNLELRAMRLPADSLQNNVMRMLGIDPAADALTFPVATKTDITGDRAGEPLAGPGLAPAKGPVESEKAPEK
jgi:hypothetical protein